MNKELRIWKIYSTVTTLALVVLAVSGFAVAQRRAEFGTIDVQRINVVEPNGTLRMVISDKARFPGEIIKGRQYPFYRHYAGMLFYNDEGTENGGLVFGGHKSAQGAASSYGHLSFDGYEQDQIFTLDANQKGSRRSVGIGFIDQPTWPVTELLRIPRSEWRHFLATHPRAEPRLSLQKAPDGSVSLALKDQHGRTRILIKVGSNGAPVIQLLNAGGKVIGQLPRPSKP